MILGSLDGLVPVSPQKSNLLSLQVDLTEYVEKHEFLFDAVLNENVSNGEVSLLFGLATVAGIIKLN